MKLFKEVTQTILDKKKVKTLESFTRKAILNMSLAKSPELQLQLEPTEFYKRVYLQEPIHEFYKYNSFSGTLADGLFGTGRRIMHALSAAFGVVAGPVEWRNGWLDQNQTIRDRVVSTLQPLDILLEKKEI